MNVPTITMDKEQARAKLKAFRAAKHKDAEEVYRRTADAYEHLAAGTVLLSLQAAFRAAGRDARQRPKIAICRADRKEVGFSRRSATQLQFWASPFRWGGGVTSQVETSATLNLFVAVDAWPNTNTAWAMVPMVPADVRPKHGQLKDWHILWEVEQWHDKPQQLTSPVDPLLLKHVEGDLWAVLASWDLTEIEQMILAQR